MTGKLNKEHFDAEVSVSSPIIWSREWHFESELNHSSNGEYLFKAIGKIGEEKSEFIGNFSLKNFHEFSGNLIYQGTFSTLSKVKFDFDVKISKIESILDLNLVTTHPSMPHVKLMFNFKEINNSERYIGKFVFDASRDINIEATLGMISHKKSLITIFGHKYKINNFIKKFDIFHEKFQRSLHFGLYLESNC